MKIETIKGSIEVTAPPPTEVDDHNGRKFLPTGEYRYPNKGDYYLLGSFVTKALSESSRYAETEGAAWILTEVPKNPWVVEFEKYDKSGGKESTITSSFVGAGPLSSTEEAEAAIQCRRADGYDPTTTYRIRNTQTNEVYKVLKPKKSEKEERWDKVLDVLKRCGEETKKQEGMKYGANIHPITCWTGSNMGSCSYVIELKNLFFKET